MEILTDEELDAITKVEEYTNTYASVNTALNVRDKAAMPSNALTVVKEGSVLKVIAKMKNGWYQVEGNAIIRIC